MKLVGSNVTRYGVPGRHLVLSRLRFRNIKARQIRVDMPDEILDRADPRAIRSSLDPVRARRLLHGLLAFRHRDHVDRFFPDLNPELSALKLYGGDGADALSFVEFPVERLGSDGGAHALRGQLAEPLAFLIRPRR